MKAWAQFIALLQSRLAGWIVVGAAAGGVTMSWIVWANPQPRSLPYMQATATLGLCLAVALMLEIIARDERARAISCAPDPRVAVPIVCRYHGVVLGMHTWIARAPISVNDLKTVRISVGMVAGGNPSDSASFPDIVVHAVR